MTSYCDREQLDIAQRLSVFVQIFSGVQHAHQKGVIHRDIKPSNILVATHDEKPVPKIIDFGVAKAIGQDPARQTMFTQQGQLIGTPEYMSPEQAGATDGGVDTRSDVYSLGVLLYELLVGTLPFDSKALRHAGYAEIQRIIRDEEPARPSTKLGGLGDESAEIAKRRRCDPRRLTHQLRGDLDWIVLRALVKDASRRYATVAALAEDVTRYLRHEPVSAGPPSSTHRLKKFLRRNKGTAMSASAVFTVLVAATVVSFQYALGEKRAKETVIEQLAETQRAQRHEQLATAESAAQASRLAAQRGKWGAVLENADRAIELGHPDPVAMRLQKVLAWDALFDRATGIAEVDRLVALPEREIGSHRAEAQLWRGVYQLWKPSGKEAGIALIQGAIEKGLPTADEAYARALVARSLPESIEYFNRALSAEPFHYRASIMLGAAVMFNGDLATAIRHFETALAKFPEDPSARVGIAACHALAGDTSGMLDALGEIGPPFDGTTLDRLGAGLAGVTELLARVDASDPAAARTASEFLAAVASAIPTFVAVAQGMNTSTDVAFPLPTVDFIPRPMAEAWGPAVGYLLQFRLKNYDAAIAILERVLPLTSDGFPRLIHAKCLLATERFEEAAEEAWYAATAPSIIKVQRHATYLALQAELHRAVPEAQRVLRNLRRFASFENLQPETRAQNAAFALRFGEPELARSIALLGYASFQTVPGCLLS